MLGTKFIPFFVLIGLISVGCSSSVRSNKISHLPFGIGDSCTTDDECTEPEHTKCYRDTTGVCMCGPGYAAYRGECETTEGGIGDYCDVGYTDDCIVENTECDQRAAACLCMPGYIPINGECIETDGGLGDPCQNNDNCVAENSRCTNFICGCDAGYQQNADTCIESDGNLGDSCSADIPCKGENLKCESEKCVCTDNFVEIGGVCIESDGSLGNPCGQTPDCKYENPFCQDNTCTCAEDHLPVDKDCFLADGNLGSPCDETTYNCTQDFTTCDLGNYPSLCICVDEYEEAEDGLCYFIKDGKLGSPCDDEYPCTDPGTDCIEDFCRCDAEHVEIDDECVFSDGSLGSKCVNSDDCKYENPFCFQNECTCDETAGFFPISGGCREADGNLTSPCNENYPCTQEFTKCDVAGSPPVCVCMEGYEDDGADVCVISADGELGSPCNEDQPCTATGSDCIDDVCRCDDQHAEIEEQCVKSDGSLGSPCGDPKDCKYENPFCAEDNICSCDIAFLPVSGDCREADGKLNSPCSEDYACTQNLTKCGNNTTPPLCVCIDQHRPGAGNLVCEPYGRLGDDCRNNGECFVSHSECGDEGKCECKIAYEENEGECIKARCDEDEDCPEDYYCSSRDQCEGKVPLGEKCNGDDDACATQNSECSDSEDICVCDSDYEREGDSCKKKPDDDDNGSVGMKMSPLGVFMATIVLLIIRI